MKLEYVAATALMIVAMPLLWAATGFVAGLVPQAGTAAAWEVALTISLTFISTLACVGHLFLTVWLGLTAMEAEE